MENIDSEKKQEDQKKTKSRKKQSGSGKINALVILMCIDMVGITASLYTLRSASDVNIFLIPAALTLVMCVITAMVFVQIRKQDIDDRERLTSDIADALGAIISISNNNQKEMDQKLEDLSEEYKIPATEIINALKALAKVSLGRSKENAEALINSNEAVVTQVMDLQDRIDELKKQASEIDARSFKENTDDNFHKVMQNLEDVTHDVQRMDQDLRRLEKVTKDLELRPVIIGEAVNGKNDNKEIEPESESDMVNDASTDIFANDDTESDDADINEDLTADIPDIDIEDDSIIPESETPDTEDTEEEQTEPDFTDDILPDITNDGEQVSEPEQEDALIKEEEEKEEEPPVIDEEEAAPELTIEEESAEDDTPAEPEPQVEETPVEPEPQVEDDTLVEPELPVEETSEEPEQLVDEPTTAPAPAEDGNKKLTPEEIAALFAQADTSSDTDTENKTSNNASDSTIQPSGDPNRMMTPEEIEALFSNVS